MKRTTDDDAGAAAARVPYDCAICRGGLGDPCMDCEANDGTLTTTCTTERGIAPGCAHVYHGHCIRRWIRKRRVCPLCNQEWVVSPVKSLRALCTVVVCRGNEARTLRALTSPDVRADFIDLLDAATRLQTKRFGDPAEPTPIQRILAKMFARYLQPEERQRVLFNE